MSNITSDIPFDRAIISQVLQEKIETQDDYALGEYKAPERFQNILLEVLADIQRTGKFRIEGTGEFNIDSLAGQQALVLYVQKVEAQYNLMSQLPKAGLANEKKVLTLI